MSTGICVLPMDDDLRRRLDRQDRTLRAIHDGIRMTQIQFADMAARLDILLEAHGIHLDELSDDPVDNPPEGLRDH
jgi:hypothetical protein